MYQLHVFMETGENCHKIIIKYSFLAILPYMCWVDYLFCFLWLTDIEIKHVWLLYKLHSSIGVSYSINCFNSISLMYVTKKMESGPASKTKVLRKVIRIILQMTDIRPQVIKLFSCSTQLSMKISLLINMKMPTIVDIFIFISKEIFMLS